MPLLPSLAQRLPLSPSRAASPPSSEGDVATGAEVAILSNGFVIRHEHRRVIGNITRLYVTEEYSAFVDVPTAEISRFERALNDPAPSFADLDPAVMAASTAYGLDPYLLRIVLNAGTEFNMPPVSPERAAQHFRELQERYNFDLVKAIAAYKIGSERVDQYGGVPPDSEVRAFVARIVKDFNKKKADDESQANKH